MSAIGVFGAAALLVAGAIEWFRYGQVAVRRVGYDKLGKGINEVPEPAVSERVTTLRWFSLYAYTLFALFSPLWISHALAGTLAASGIVAGVLAGCLTVVITYFAVGAVVPWHKLPLNGQVYATGCTFLGLFTYLAVLEAYGALFGVVIMTLLLLFDEAPTLLGW